MSSLTKKKHILCNQREFTEKLTFFSVEYSDFCRNHAYENRGFFKSMVLKERNAKTSLFWRCLLLGPKTTAKNLWFETNLRSVAQFVLKWEPFKGTVSMGKDS